MNSPLRKFIRNTWDGDVTYKEATERFSKLEIVAIENALLKNPKLIKGLAMLTNSFIYKGVIVTLNPKHGDPFKHGYANRYIATVDGKEFSFATIKEAKESIRNMVEADEAIYREVDQLLKGYPMGVIKKVLNSFGHTFKTPYLKERQGVPAMVLSNIIIHNKVWTVEKIKSQLDGLMAYENVK
jgi:hypothetical protein